MILQKFSSFGDDAYSIGISFREDEVFLNLISLAVDV